MTKEIEIVTDDGGKVSAYIAYPKSKGCGAVVVLQEIFGVNANIRQICDGFAAQGYHAIAPDLFWRQEPGVQIDPAEEGAHERALIFMKGLDVDTAVKDALCAADFVHPLSGNGKVAALGFCLGGKLAYLMADSGRVSSVVTYYGTGLHQVLDKSPLAEVTGLIHVAGEDYLCPPEAQQKIRDKFDGNDRFTVAVYEGMGHAFARIGGPTYDAAKADQANAATDAFLSQNIGHNVEI